MSGFEIITSERLRERMYHAQHPTGLNVYVYPNGRSDSAYASVVVRYGSINERYRLTGGGLVTTPAGVAHFLEHKLFENEDGDAFERFSRLGAQANASTSFDHTRYYFETTDHFDEAFEILLDFVQRPYFADDKVAKEQGIIGQELRMYEDDPDWQVFFNLLRAMYSRHAVRNDIGGTVRSIAEITPAVLYDCYRAFYQPRNMAVVVTGDVQPDHVLELVDKWIVPSDHPAGVAEPFDEPDGVVERFVERRMDTGVTQFQLGFKDGSERPTARDSVISDVLLDAVAGPTTTLYERLLTGGLINSTFGAGYFAVEGANAAIISGESSRPEEVRDQLLRELEHVRQNGLDPEQLECARRTRYARMLRETSENRDVGGMLTEQFLRGLSPYDLIEAAADLRPEEADAALADRLRPESCALSVVRPAGL